MRQTPFLRLLIPIIIGILLFKFISPSINLFPIGAIGLVIIFLSFFIPKNLSFALRWLFGAGLMFLLFSLTIQYCQYRTSLVICNFPQKSSSYTAKILDYPQHKKRSLACEVRLTYPIDKKVILYFEPDTNSLLLQPGDNILINAFIKPFRNLGNPDEFDYKGFMQNKGFSGSAYLSSLDWIDTGQRSRSIKTEALRVRAKILDVYKTYEFGDDESSFLSAITLGYKADLSDDLKEAFRVSGTSHVLAVSGLHVGLVYIIISFFFSFLGKRGKALILKQILVLLCLWGYVFITGMPVSVVRAAIMLSLLCIGNIFRRKGLSYNTVAVTAFFILALNPFYLFDVGFQLSFVAVLSIMFFQPKFSKIYIPKTKTGDYIWSLFTISLAAQLGVFPFVLYYFGTFPSYFFIANLLVLPSIAIIIYSAVLLTFLSLFPVFNFSFLKIVYNVIIVFMQFLIKTVLQVVRLFESLPMSVLEGHHISLVQVFLIFAIIIFLSQFILYKHTRQLIMCLVLVILLSITHTLSFFNQPANQFVVYNSYNESDIGYRINGEKLALEVNSNLVVSHPSAKVILLTENSYKSKESNYVVPVDFLILASDNSFSVTELATFFQPKGVIIDSSIARYAAAKMEKECEKLNITFHDISNSGAFCVNF